MKRIVSLWFPRLSADRLARAPAAASTPAASPASTVARDWQVKAAATVAWTDGCPRLAAINGHAIGLGLDIAAYCDLRVASSKAKFASSFVKVGLVPGDGGAWILPRIVGYARAAELILTGDTIGASEALAMGLVNEVVDEGEVMAAALRLAARVVANPRRTLRLAKRLLRQAQAAPLSDVLELSAAIQALTHETADHEEALAAFSEKRPPKFTGA